MIASYIALAVLALLTLGFLWALRLPKQSADAPSPAEATHSPCPRCGRVFTRRGLSRHVNAAHAPSGGLGSDAADATQTAAPAKSPPP